MTCEALSLGVPVVSLAADRAIGRYGASLLGAVGLDHLVADTVERYVAIAVALATNEAERHDLRVSLRERFARSAISDGAGFARAREAAYRTMWRDWCLRQ
jgi:predicted O-linked N-acetylglucosamine transferase (SPINDLY family)